jgi:hypothetical protein
MNLKETGFEGVDWFQLATGSGSIKAGNFLTIMQPTASQGLCTIELVEDSLVLEELRQINALAATSVSYLSILFIFMIMFL